MRFALETLLVKAMLKSVLKTLVTSSSPVTGVAPLFNYFHHHVYGFHRSIKWLCSLGHEHDNQPCSTLPARQAWQSYSFSHPQNSILFLLTRDLRKFLLHPNLRLQQFCPSHDPPLFLIQQPVGSVINRWLIFVMLPTQTRAALRRLLPLPFPPTNRLFLSTDRVQRMCPT